MWPATALTIFVCKYVLFRRRDICEVGGRSQKARIGSEEILSCVLRTRASVASARIASVFWLAVEFLCWSAPASGRLSPYDERGRILAAKFIAFYS